MDCMNNIDLEVFKDLLNNLIMEERECTKIILKGEFDKLPLCSFGITTCKFLEQDENIINTIEDIKKITLNSSFKNKIITLEKQNEKLELQAINDKLYNTNYSEEEF